MLAARMEFEPITITASPPPAPKEPGTWDYVGAVLDALTPKPAAAATTATPTVIVQDKPFPWLPVGLALVGTGAIVFLATRKRRRNPARRRRRGRRRRR